MKNRELIEKLQALDAELEVVLPVQSTGGGCGCCGYVDTDLESVEEVRTDSRVIYKWLPGPRGGLNRRTAVEENCIVVAE